MSALDAVSGSTYVLGDLRDAPTSHLVLAALSLTSQKQSSIGRRQAAGGAGVVQA
jgi:hypothetical protein